MRRTVPPLEAIRQADEKQKAIDARNALLPPGAPREPSVPRLQMRTLKKHFSKLSQFWIHAGRLSHVPKAENPFRGWEYQGVRRKLKKRGPWSDADLNALLASQWFDEDRVGSDHWWVTVIGMWSGLRVEEIARLRPAEDIREIAGVMAFVIQEHPAPEPWSPKTESGERTVPIHSALLELGIMDFVDRRRREGASRLFPSYRITPSSDKLSARFVSDFSRHKNSIGIGPKTTFHSWRHNVATILRNKAVSEARESWIDAVLGHAGGEDDEGKPVRQSVGVTVYLDAVWMQNLKATVEAIRYPDEVDFSRLRRP
ncbi:tyrosine-type recombinase/integrase [Roseomonas sp. BN140053]|uniref:tyrosine-type recombinase/integrase n=1 Tax=Roseomonas sp. BN140053 TaxID=3391898 RepID=UPI0039E8409D